MPRKREHAKQVTVDGLTVAYTDVGAGVPVLLMHGNPDSRLSWAPIIDQLAGRVRVIAPDFPGFGDSEPFPPHADLLPAGMASFWGAFAAAVGVEKPLVAVVHDLGGPWLFPWIAAHPECVRGVVILNTLFQRRYQWHPVARIWQRRGLGELSMMLMTRRAFRQEMQRNSQLSPEFIDAMFERIHPTMKRTVLRVYRACQYPNVILADWEDRLLRALADIPCRVIWGDTDPYIPPDFADAYGVNATHVPDAGHWHHLEQPERCVEAILELSGL